jgi:quinol monooxygenase YgiN
MINPITVTGDIQRFEKVVNEIMGHMAGRPGFAGLRFFRSAEHPDRYCMLAEWDSLQAHQDSVDAMTDDVKALFLELRGLTEVAPDFYSLLHSRAGGSWVPGSSPPG